MDAIRVFVRSCTQLSIFGPFLAHLGLLWGPRWTKCGFYWPFPMIPGTLSTLKGEAVVLEGATPQKLAAGGQYLMKMMIFLLDKHFNRVEKVQF